MPASLAEVSRRMVEAVAALGDPATGDVAALIDGVAALIPAADSVSVTRLRQGRFSTTVSSSTLADRGDLLQYELESGPCVDAVIDDAIYSPTDLGLDDRWPEFGQRAVAELDVHSMLSYRLHTGDDESIEALNLYSRRVHGFDDVDRLTGLLAATQVALALGNAKSRQLTRALEHSREIGAATGVLMARHALTYDEAFDLLRVASQNLNRRLREVAADVVLTGDLRIPAAEARPAVHP